MKRIAVLLVAVAAVASMAASWAPASSSPRKRPLRSLASKFPPGYRDWKLISVAHEEGSLNDLRAILGNDVAIKAYRAGKLPLPDGAMIARVAWSYVPLQESSQAFGHPQSFVAGSPTNLQFMVKDSKKYASTGGWGFAQFDDAIATRLFRLVERAVGDLDQIFDAR